MGCDRLKTIGKAIWEEVTFWVEVFADYLGWDKSPYHWVFEQYENDLKYEQHQEEIRIKRAKYYKTS